MKMQENETLRYYAQNALAFVSSTQNVDMSEIQNSFSALLPKDAHVLDFGCGSGRDSLAFLRKGFFVDAADACPEFCEATKKLTEGFNTSGKIRIRQIHFSELCESQKYDGIWACASLLHVPKQELPEILCKIEAALKPNGVFYCSFKFGDFEGMRNGRYFSDFSETELCSLIEKSASLEKIKLWKTKDSRPERSEIWLNSLWRNRSSEHLPDL